MPVNASPSYRESQMVRARFRSELFDDFANGVAPSALNFVSSVSGTGASNTADTSLVDNTNFGIVQSSTGTTATGRAGFTTSILSLGNTVPDTGQFWWECRIRVGALSDATNTYKLWVGLGDAFDVAGVPTDAHLFSYTHSETSANWRCSTFEGGISALHDDSTVTVAANTWYKLAILYTPSGSFGDTKFYINDVLRSTHTGSTMPIGTGEVFGFGWKIEKSAGTTARTCHTDYVYLTKEFTNAHI